VVGPVRGVWLAASRRFMAATSLVGFRFGVFPRWLSTFGFLIGVAMSLTGAFAGPLDFLFPVWLFVVSVTLVITGRRHPIAAHEEPA
jgi:hypothetical protein